MRGLQVNSERELCVGVLALQGAFDAHCAAMRACGLAASHVRTPRDLEAVDGLIIPGGESSTMSQLLESSGLWDPIRSRIDGGMPVWGTCAGLILLATEILDGRSDQLSFGALDVSVRRNAFGRQVDSFEDDVEIVGEPQPFHGVFIRAPRIERVGSDVEILGSYRGEPVLVRHGVVMGASFHPELTDDLRLHQMFAKVVSDHAGTDSMTRAEFTTQEKR